MVDGRVADRLLGRHVRGRAERHAGRGEPGTRPGTILRRGRDRLGDAEVSDDRVPAREKHILRLEVAVHHASTVRVRQRVGQLADDAGPVRHRQRALARETSAQRFAVHVRHHVKQQAVRITRVVDAEHVGVCQPSRDADLMEEALGTCDGDVPVENLHGDGPIVAEVTRQVNRGHPAAPKLTLDGVVGRQGAPKRVSEVGALCRSARRLSPGELGEHRRGEMGRASAENGVEPCGAVARVEQPRRARVQRRVRAARLRQIGGALGGRAVERTVHDALNYPPSLGGGR